MDKLYEFVSPQPYNYLAADLPDQIRKDVTDLEQEQKSKEALEKFNHSVFEMDEAFQDEELTKEMVEKLQILTGEEQAETRKLLETQIFYNLRLNVEQFDIIVKFLFDEIEVDINNITFAEFFFAPYFSPVLDALRADDDYKAFRKGQMDVRLKVSFMQFTNFLELMKAWKMQGYKNVVESMSPIFRRLGTMNAIFRHFGDQLQNTIQHRDHLLAMAASKVDGLDHLPANDVNIPEIEPSIK